MAEKQYFRNHIKRFYSTNGRTFFWRKRKLPAFQVLIVELFLQKTRAENAENIISQFIKEYPSNQKLYIARKKTIFRKISRLGLGNQRSKALRNISLYLHAHHRDRIPKDINDLRKIPNIGMYIANAIMCFAFGKRYPLLDVNTSRIISRFFSINNHVDLRRNSELYNQSQKLVPYKHIKEYHWGLLDLGALFCRTKPICCKCPLKRKCSYFINTSKEIRKR